MLSKNNQITTVIVMCCMLSAIANSNPLRRIVEIDMKNKCTVSLLIFMRRLDREADCLFPVKTETTFNRSQWYNKSTLIVDSIL